MTDRELIRLAIEAQKKSYSPYSNFQVGAALLAENGQVFTGCNIESASYTPTNCAERTAFFKAVSEGVVKFTAIAIVGGFADQDRDYCYPCGVCRQVMVEFCNSEDFKILVAKNIDEYKTYTLAQILPYAFGAGDLTRNIEDFSTS